MRVRLIPNQNFTITPASPELQQTGHDKSAAWLWNVTPKARDGNHILYARVEVFAQWGGKLVIFDEYTRRVAVRVRIGTWSAFLNGIREATTLADLVATLFRSWEKTFLALAGLITAIVGVWVLVRRRKPPSAP
jgi:hypothetical protein